MPLQAHNGASLGQLQQQGLGMAGVIAPHVTQHSIGIGSLSLCLSPWAQRCCAKRPIAGPTATRSHLMSPTHKSWLPLPFCTCLVPFEHSHDCPKCFIFCLVGIVKHIVCRATAQYTLIVLFRAWAHQSHQYYGELTTWQAMQLKQEHAHQDHHHSHMLSSCQVNRFASGTLRVLHT